MAEVGKLTMDKFRDIASQLPFNNVLLAKDYHVTILLYLLKDMEGIYFKGGTALQKIFLNYARLSEDIDFTVTRDIGEIKREIKSILKRSKVFERITKDKDVEGFTRLIAHYTDFSGGKDRVFIDLNKRAKLLLKPEKHKIKHFYKGSIPDFSFNTLAREEMIAEKMSAAIARNRPRDHYDLYRIIKAGLPINHSLVKRKCKQSGVEFNIVRMFSRANKLKNRWEKDVSPLIVEEISFQKVMRVLARHFKLKSAKKNLKRSS